MRIEAYCVRPARLRNRDPQWRYGNQHIPVLEGVFVALRAEDGTVGQGFSPVLGHLGFDLRNLACAVERLAQRTMGEEAAAYRGIAARLFKEAPHVRPAIAAVEMAVHDLAARLLRIPVSQLLGGPADCRIPVVRIVPIKTPDETARAAALLAAEGYRALKLKAAGDLEVDLKRVFATRRAVGEDVALYVDPNQGYDVDGAEAFCRRVAEAGVCRVEQPIQAGDHASMARIAALDGGPVIEADECLFSTADVARLAAHRAANGICLKLTRSGGIQSSIAMAAVAEAAGLEARMGTAFGGALISLAAAHAAAALPMLTGFAEVGEFMHFEDEYHEPARLIDGHLVIGGGAGFGQTARRAWSQEWRSPRINALSTRSSESDGRDRP